jgi:hypothetical protein
MLAEYDAVRRFFEVIEPFSDVIRGVVSNSDVYDAARQAVDRAKRSAGS